MKKSALIRMSAVVICVLLAAFTALMIVSPYEGVVVVTDSMRPAIPKWSFVIVYPTDVERMAVGDIVLFAAPEQAGAALVLHRIVGIDEQAQLMLTKGDTNNHADLFPVSWSLIQGSYVAHAPAAGWLVYYARQHAPLLAFALFAAFIVSIAAAWLARRRVEA